MKKATKKTATPPTPELPYVAAVVLVLDNGEEHTVDVADETRVPEDWNELPAAAALAPGRMAFIGGQAERALYVVRVAEVRLKDLEGVTNRQRRLKIEADRPGEFVSEAAVQAAVDCWKEVVAARLRLAELRLHYGILKSLYDAASQRAWTINRLLDQVAKSQTAHSG